MVEVMRRAGDAVLGLFLPKAEAGACDPGAGSSCGTCTCLRQASGAYICYKNVWSCYTEYCYVSSSRC
ncbi:hypothetical protein [Hamadaea flava]|nr:hypothetical protein [Hamadaea flava]